MISFRLDRAEARRIFFFLIVGGLSTVVNYAVFWVCLDGIGINYLVSSGAGYMTGVLAGFLLNARLTFRVREIKKSHPVIYITVYIVSLLLSMGTLYLLVSLFHLPPKLANVLVIGQSTVTNYLGCKYLVFRNTKDHDAPSL